MKKIIFKSLLWFVITLVGSLIILNLNHVTDLKELHKPSLLFGLFIGMMAMYIPQIIPSKAQLKELGFKWAAKKKAWYWYQGDYKRKHKKDFSLDEIRLMHEVKKVKTGSTHFALNA
jgi:uncharacterized membrane protein YobD (UPF0266 family)